MTLAQPSLLGLLLCFLLLGGVSAQQAGTQKPEFHPPLPIKQCNQGACWDEDAKIVLDSQRRWVHDARTPEAYENCIKDEGEAASWDPEICPDPESCARNCAVDGVDEASYSDTYGIHPIGNGIQLGFVTGSNVGARVYVLDSDEENYKVFRLKNKEISFDVDVSSLPCGVNAALYLVQMDPNGQKGMGANDAGAKFGTGYCDAQCPHQSKFVQGEANMQEWRGGDESGHFGSCCAELDLWEGNSKATAFTVHPCNGGQTRCEGTACGDAEKQEHYLGLCDKDGCDFNAYRLGVKDFFGPGMTVNSAEPITVVTQFLTVDGTDGGELSEIRRFYIQGDRVIENAKSVEPGIAGSSMSDGYCSNLKQAFVNTRAQNNPQGEFDQFNAKGGLKTMGASMDAGMVLVLSLWDDPASAMRWLDSDDPQTLPESTPGVMRGPCPLSEGEASQVEGTAAGASVSYTNIRYGEIGTTHPGLPGGGPAQPEAQPAPVVPPPVAPVAPAVPAGAYGAGVDPYAGATDPYGTGATTDAYGAGVGDAYGAGAYGAYEGQAGAYGDAGAADNYGQGAYPQKAEVRHDGASPMAGFGSLQSSAGLVALAAASAVAAVALYAAMGRQRAVSTVTGTSHESLVSYDDVVTTAQE